MKNVTSENPSNRNQATVGSSIIRVLAGMELATITLLALFVLTWFATLEQTVNGLKPMLDKYFDWRLRNLFFFPEIGKPDFLIDPDKQGGPPEPMKVFFPMLNGFWLCVIFTVNLTLGGIIRFKKTRKKVGILITHMSIVFLMVSAGVTHFMEERGLLQIYEGDASNVAQDYHHQVIEVSELEDGEVTRVHLIDWEEMEDLRKGHIGQRLFRMKALPFDLKVERYAENAQVLPSRFSAPTNRERIRDGYYLRKIPSEKETEINLAGVELAILDKDGQELGFEFLSSRSLAPATISVDGSDYLLRMRKRLWQMPFTVQLDDFRVERDPGTLRAAAFESDVTRIDETDSEEVLIEMNKPMRREGWTFFQAKWGPQEEEDPESYYSVLEVVRNPADQWPLYSLLIAMLGLFWQFGSKLFRFIIKPRKPASV